jgi:hypothetical protein
LAASDRTTTAASQSGIESRTSRMVARCGRASSLQFNCRVDAVHYDEASNVWRLRLSDGRTLIMATGSPHNVDAQDLRVRRARVCHFVRIADVGRSGTVAHFRLGLKDKHE